MPTTFPIPTRVDGAKNLNVSSPYPYPGEPQADWDARYQGIESRVPLRYIGHWKVSNNLGVGEMAAEGGVISFNVTGPEHVGDQARLEALEVGDTIYVQQATGYNTIVLADAPTTAAGVTSATVGTETPVGVINSDVTFVWITEK